MKTSSKPLTHPVNYKTKREKVERAGQERLCQLSSSDITNANIQITADEYAMSKIKIRVR